MGYNIEFRGSEFFMAMADLPKALLAIQLLRGRETHDTFAWIDKDFWKVDRFDLMMEEWRYPVGYDSEGNVTSVGFEGEKLGDEEYLFEAIAPFVKAGSYIEMYGEEGHIWRWIFDGRTVREHTGSVSF